MRTKARFQGFYLVITSKLLARNIRLKLFYHISEFCMFALRIEVREGDRERDRGS